MSDEERRAKQNILKVEVEKILCEYFTPTYTYTKGYDIVANLMCFDSHDFNKLIGKILREFEFEFSVDRPEGWNDFSKKISKDVWDGNYNKLSKKTQGLRTAVYGLAVLADCFEHIEKSELKLKEDQ